MADKSDAAFRLRRAVRENNLFLVKRLIQRTDMRNPDPGMKRYTSLAWAAVLAHEETFEFLLNAGHDDEELSKDSENNTILMLLADSRPAVAGPYSSTPANNDAMSAVLRMTRLYCDRYSSILDWSNVHGKTALHMAALKGSEELVRMFCDLGADFDLSDNEGNTPLHYASSWGHIPVVQLLIERGCQFSARNNEGFTASDYAYSFSTRDTLQDSARLQFENNKKTRRQIFAQAAARGNEWGRSQPINMPAPLPSRILDRHQIPRMRSGSGTSRTTATSDSGENEGNVQPSSQTSFSASSSPSQPSANSASSGSFFHISSSSSRSTNMLSANNTLTMASPTSASLLSAPAYPTFSLSPIATRMRERDADAMEKYMRRNRSGSSSTDNKSQNGSNFSSAGPSSNGDDISSLTSPAASGSSTPRKRLRPSFSAAQLRTGHESSSSSSSPIVITNVYQPPEARIRAGTNPAPPRPSLAPLHLIRSSSQTNSNRSIGKVANDGVLEKESFTGPPSQYAKFPDPPFTAEQDNSTPTLGRRLPFHILSKPLLDPSAGHRRGASATSVRGG